MVDEKNKIRKRGRAMGILRSLDPSDPRSMDHPSHDEQFLELARAIGRSLADDEWDRRHPKK
jgi:hypothetical protein